MFLLIIFRVILVNCIISSKCCESIDPSIGTITLGDSMEKILTAFGSPTGADEKWYYGASSIIFDSENRFKQGSSYTEVLKVI